MAMKTVLDCLESGSRYLEERGIEDARRNMQWLVAKQLGCSRLDLYLQFDRPLAEEDLAPLREGLKRRAKGEPLQHLLGTVEFCGLEFRCDARALVPRPETEELVSSILALPLAGEPERILDVGTGSGVIGLSLLKSYQGREKGVCREAVLSDISAEALALARENAELHELSASATFVQGDLCEAVEGRFPLIVANLPYVAEGERGKLPVEVGHDPPGALFAGPDGLAVIRRFVPQALAHLASHGTLAMEIGHDQGPAVADVLAAAGFVRPNISNDLSGNPRFVFAEAPGPP